jgi:hypothetical protein
VELVGMCLITEHKHCGAFVFTVLAVKESVGLVLNESSALCATIQITISGGIGMEFFSVWRVPRVRRGWGRCGHFA